jgi:hypothetical protein
MRPPSGLFLTPLIVLAWVLSACGAGLRLEDRPDLGDPLEVWGRLKARAAAVRTLKLLARVEASGRDGEQRGGLALVLDRVGDAGARTPGVAEGGTRLHLEVLSPNDLTLYQATLAEGTLVTWDRRSGECTREAWQGRTRLLGVEVEADELGGLLSGLPGTQQPEELRLRWDPRGERTVVETRSGERRAFWFLGRNERVERLVVQRGGRTLLEVEYDEFVPEGGAWLPSFARWEVPGEGTRLKLRVKQRAVNAELPAGAFGLECPQDQ